MMRWDGHFRAFKVGFITTLVLVLVELHLLHKCTVAIDQIVDPHRVEAIVNGPFPPLAKPFQRGPTSGLLWVKLARVGYPTTWCAFGSEGVVAEYESEEKWARARAEDQKGPGTQASYEFPLMGEENGPQALALIILWQRDYRVGNNSRGQRGSHRSDSKFMALLATMTAAGLQQLPLMRDRRVSATTNAQGVPYQCPPSHRYFVVTTSGGDGKSSGGGGGGDAVTLLDLDSRLVEQLIFTNAEERMSTLPPTTLFGPFVHPAMSAAALKKWGVKTSVPAGWTGLLTDALDLRERPILVLFHKGEAPALEEFGSEPATISAAVAEASGTYVWISEKLDNGGVTRPIFETGATPLPPELLQRQQRSPIVISVSQGKKEEVTEPPPVGVFIAMRSSSASSTLEGKSINPAYLFLLSRQAKYNDGVLAIDRVQVVEGQEWLSQLDNSFYVKRVTSVTNAPRPSSSGAQPGRVTTRQQGGGGGRPTTTVDFEFDLFMPGANREAVVDYVKTHLAIGKKGREKAGQAHFAGTMGGHFAETTIGGGDTLWLRWLGTREVPHCAKVTALHMGESSPLPPAYQCTLVTQQQQCGGVFDALPAGQKWDFTIPMRGSERGNETNGGGGVGTLHKLLVHWASPPPSPSQQQPQQREGANPQVQATENKAKNAKKGVGWLTFGREKAENNFGPFTLVTIQIVGGASPESMKSEVQLQQIYCDNTNSKKHCFARQIPAPAASASSGSCSSPIGIHPHPNRVSRLDLSKLSSSSSPLLKAIAASAVPKFYTVGPFLEHTDPRGPLRGWVLKPGDLVVLSFLAADTEVAGSTVRVMVTLHPKSKEPVIRKLESERSAHELGAFAPPPTSSLQHQQGSAPVASASMVAKEWVIPPQFNGAYIAWTFGTAKCRVTLVHARQLYQADGDVWHTYVETIPGGYAVKTLVDDGVDVFPIGRQVATMATTSTTSSTPPRGSGGFVTMIPSDEEVEKSGNRHNEAYLKKAFPKGLV